MIDRFMSKDEAYRKIHWNSGCKKSYFGASNDDDLLEYAKGDIQMENMKRYLRIFHKTKSLYKEQYGLYLQSDEWRDKRGAILERDNYQCRICGDTNNLEVHHLTYDRVYNESDYDLVTVCADCHEIIHKF